MRISEINGKKIVDAKNKMILVINDEDIANGKKKSENSCAAAVALVRQMDAISARVHLSRTYVEFPKRWVRYVTPSALRTEIVSFDRGHKFTPDTYVLSPLQPSQHATGKRRGTSSNGKSDKPKKPRKMHYLTDIRSMAHPGK